MMILLRNYADPRIRGKDGMSILSRAKEVRHIAERVAATVAILLEYIKIHEEIDTAGWKPDMAPYFEDNINDQLILARPETILDNYQFLSEDARQRLRQLVVTWRVNPESGLNEPSFELTLE